MTEQSRGRMIPVEMVEEAGPEVDPTLDRVVNTWPVERLLKWTSRG